MMSRMKRLSVMGVVLLVSIVTFVFAGGWEAPIFGTFQDGEGIHTNGRRRVGIATIFLTGDLQGSNATIKITSNSGAVTNILASVSSNDTTMSYIDGAHGVMLDRLETLIFTTDTTNLIEFTIFEVSR